MEEIEVLDRKGHKKGYVVCRDADLKRGEYCLVIHVWIKNRKGEYLVQERSKNKKVDPYLWSVVAGYVSNHEDSKMAVIREIKEEFGITILKSDMKFIKRMFPRSGIRNIADVYEVNLDIDSSDVIIDNKEVSDYDFWSFEKLRTMKKVGIFKNFDEMYDNYFKTIFVRGDN